MKYLKAYLRICEKFSEDDCRGCPFELSQTKSVNCHSWILKNEGKAKEMIVDLVTKMKAQAANTNYGFGGDGTYTHYCKNCRKPVTADENDLIWDGYIDAYLFTCPECGAEDEVAEAVKTTN